MGYCWEFTKCLDAPKSCKTCDMKDHVDFPKERHLSIVDHKEIIAKEEL